MTTLEEIDGGLPIETVTVTKRRLPPWWLIGLVVAGAVFAFRR